MGQGVMGSRVGTASSACASGCRASADGSTPARGRRAASPCGSACRWSRLDPRAARRGPDDGPRGLASLLSLEEDIEVVAQVGRGDAVLDAARAQRPDVALLDIEMPGVTGIDAAGLLRTELPATRVLILTTFSRPGYLRRAMEQGAA